MAGEGTPLGTTVKIFRARVPGAVPGTVERLRDYCGGVRHPSKRISEFPDDDPRITRTPQDSYSLDGDGPLSKGPSRL